MQTMKNNCENAFQVVSVTAGILLSLLLPSPNAGASDANTVSSTGTNEPPLSWIDPDTGHRVIRLTREPGSDSFYFNDNPFTPDGKKMVYTTSRGISVLNLETLHSTQIVTGNAHPIIVAHHSANLYYTRSANDPFIHTLWRINLDTGENRKLADLPRRAAVSAINADETLGAGAYIEGDAHDGGAYDGARSWGRISDTNIGEPADKSEMMARRLAARLPMTLFTIDLRTGKIKKLLQHQTDWLNHLQFSPTDPTLLMYCHEGAWQQVDRIWTIRTDGSHNQLIHKRTMELEMAGHEWWSADGDMIYYQLHILRGRVCNWIASYNVKTGERIWRYYNTDQSSIHDNSSPDDKLFCGDGDRHSPWIFLFHPEMVPSEGTFGKNLIKGGYLESEKLVNMSKQEYHLEPNPIFTPDMKWIVFRSNMFGPDYVFAVEIARANASP